MVRMLNCRPNRFEGDWRGDLAVFDGLRQVTEWVFRRTFNEKRL
jgi:hypothetical protein